MLNQIVLQGRLTADPELRQTQSGISVATFRLAVERDYHSQDPAAETADFINIVAWRGTAEFATRYFLKGQLIALTGRLQTRSYTDQDGNRRYMTEVVAEHLYFCEKRGERSIPISTVTTVAPSVPTVRENELPDDDQLPF